MSVRRRYSVADGFIDAADAVANFSIKEPEKVTDNIRKRHECRK